MLRTLLLLAACLARAENLPPQVAGQFYPADPKELAAQVDGLLARASSAAVGSEGLEAVLVPHAGYPYSGATAAEAYRLLQGRHFATVVVLGTGHLAPIAGAASISSGSFATPLGAVEIDSAAVAELEALSGWTADQPGAFAGEHSVEAQLPFLQRTLGSFKLVPLLMNTDDPVRAMQFGHALAVFLKSRNALLIVSSDLSHYPDAKLARIVDRSSLAALLEAPEDPSFFWAANRSLMAAAGSPALICTECGEAAVLAAQAAMKELGAWPRLLKYSNSGEAPGTDPRRVVGYGAVVWLKGPAPSRPLLSSEQRSALLKIARRALEDKLLRGEASSRSLSDDPDFNLPAAVFVTLRKKGQPKESSLRGCVGSLEPGLPLAEAVRSFALKSALEDPRFPRVWAGELDTLAIEISRLSPLRPAASYEAVQPGQGVVVKKDGAEGIFLPQVWEELPDKAKFLSELCAQKAGLPADCWKDPSAQFEVFDAEPFQE